jgi:hypothetical protein
MNFDIELTGIKACLIASLYPFVIYLSETLITNKKYRYFILIIFLTTSLYLKSRLLLIGIIITFFLSYKQKIKLKSIIILSCLGIIPLFFLNSDSIIGRFFIWKIIISNLQTVPLNGFGFDSFKLNYANWQSNYFVSNQLWSKYHYLADSPSFAYNEILNFYVEIGIFSIIIFCVTFFINISSFKKINNSFYKHVIVSNIVILLFSQFSFPLHNILILTIFVCNHILLFTIHFKRVKLFCILLCITITISVILLFYQNLKVKADWHYAQSIPTQYKLDKVAQYQNCYKSLRKNQYYLTDFCEYLISENMTNSSLNVLLSNEIYFNQYEKYLLLGDIYLRQRNYALAKRNYKKANLIIPVRLIPLGNLMTISLLEKDTLSAKYYSNRILSQPIKIKTRFTDRIKKDASKILEIKLW